MKDILLQLAAYSSWANQKLFEIVLKQPEEDWHKEVASSFTTLHATILHMWDAESAWWQRIKLQEVVTAPSANFKGTTRDLVSALQHQNHLYENWIRNASDAAIEHVFQYYNSKREHFKQPVCEVLLHVFNHGTYHRGQIVTMLRGLGVTKIPQTDFVVWTRLKK